MSSHGETLTELDMARMLQRAFFESNLNELADGVEQLRKAHPWLRELDIGRKANLQNLRQEFLTDGHTFLLVLAEFLNAIKWQEFVFYWANYTTFNVVLVELLNFAFQEWSSIKHKVQLLGKLKWEDLECSKGLGYVKEDHMRKHRLLEAIKSRWDAPRQSNHDVTFLGRKKAISVIQEASKLSHETIISSLSDIETSIAILRDLHVEEMTFGFDVAHREREPPPLATSGYWKRVGEDLFSLASLVGANVSRRRTVINPVTVFTALKNVLNNEGVAVNIMLARIEEGGVKMRKQQQVITALQFRHLLEHLPRSLRSRRLAKAEEGSAAEATKVAKEWDQKNENERWLIFWEEAVRQVYDVYKKRGRPDWTPSSKEGQQDLKPSPFAKVLNEYLAEASKDRNSAQAVRWLACESTIGQRMKKLYSTLSQIIHQFSDGEFTVDPLNFSPDDARLLAALVPEKLEVEDDELKSEFRRYVWSNPATEGTAQPAAHAAALTQAASTQATPTQTASIQDLIVRAARCWQTLRSDQLRAILSGELTVSSAEPASDRVTLNVRYRPVESDINPDSLLHSVSLAVLVDLVGHMGIAVFGPSEQRVKGKHFEMQATNLGTVIAGDEIEISLTVEQHGKKKDQRWSVEMKMKMKDPSTALVAKGYFKAWKFEAVEAG